MGILAAKVKWALCFVRLQTAEPTGGGEVPLLSTHILHPPPSPSPPFPLPLISTFQHTDTVTAKAEFQRGTWSASRPL